MGKRKRLVLSDPAMNMTSMIDVVFLLIVFFMLVAEIAKDDLVPLELPKARASMPEEKVKERLILNVNRVGDLYLKSKKMPPDGTQFRKELKAFANRYRDPATGLCEEAVKIRGDVMTPYLKVQTIMLMCIEAKIWKVSFGAQPGKKFLDYESPQAWIERDPAK